MDETELYLRQSLSRLGCLSRFHEGTGGGGAWQLGRRMEEESEMQKIE